MVVRGHGSPSACAGMTVTVSGVVTAAIPALGGFFLQDPTGDGDPATSDAIFVVTDPSATMPDPGSVAQVTGKVFELTRSGLSGSVTELDSTGGSVQFNGTAPLPAAVVLDPTPDQQITQPNVYFQAMEGMLVSYPASTVMAPNDDSGVFYTLRDDRLPAGQRSTDSDPGTGLPVLIDTAGASLVFDVNELDTVGNMTGVLHFDYGLYRVQPLEAFDTESDGLAPSTAATDQPVINLASLDCDLLSATMTSADFNTKLAKLANAIQNELGSPDLIAVQGVGDSATLTKLAQAAGGSYLGLFQKSPCNPTGGSMGILFNTTTTFPLFVRQYDLEAPQFKKPVCTLPNGQVFTNPLFENPVMRVDVAFQDGSNATLLLNDWRSQVPGSAAQASFGVFLLQSIIDNLNQPNVILMGDFNQSEDSAALKSIESNLGFVNLSRSVDAGQRYTVTQAGRSQALDHFLVSAPIVPSVMSTGFAHYNADFSAVGNRDDATTPLRASDHDSPFLHLNSLSAAPAQ